MEFFKFTGNLIFGVCDVCRKALFVLNSQRY